MISWPPPPVAVQEKDAVPIIRESLGDFLDHVKHAWTMCALALHALREHSQPEPTSFVAAIMLSRIGNDLYQVHELASKGYGAQAAAVACTIFETSPVMARIVRGHPQAAVKWMEHSKIKKMPWDSLKDTLRFHMLQIFPKKNDVEIDLLLEIQLADYAVLAAYKHANPIMHMMNKNVDADEPWIFPLELGPIRDDLAQATLAHTINSAVSYAQLAISELYNYLPNSQEKNVLGLYFNESMSMSRELNAKAEARWGNRESAESSNSNSE